MDALVADHAYAGWILAAVTVDPALLDHKTERINITLPRRVLLRLDALARAAGRKTVTNFLLILAGPFPECLVSRVALPAHHLRPRVSHPTRRPTREAA